jgi:uncharacterized alkaline shock family protein YloU
MAEICPFDVTPLTVPRFVNNLPVYSINYTNQDFHSLKRRTLELIKSNFGEKFNDLNESSLAVMLIECWAAMADMLSFKIDQLANELFIDTVTELENAFRLAKLVGYKPIPPLPAKAMFYARINATYSQDLVINAPISINLDGLGYDIAYELFPADGNNDPVFGSSIVIPAGSMFTEAIVGLEGATRKTSFISTGKANQIFTIAYENVFFGSIKVTIGDQLWEEVEHFTEAYPKPEYIVEYDAYYKPSIIFGDNRTGLVPPPESKIKVEFRIPNRSTSEIISGAFDTKVIASAPEGKGEVLVSLKNYTKSEYGYPGDSISDIRKKLPAYLRTQNRAVTGADYKYLTDSFASPHDGLIGKSNIVLRNHGCAGNVIDIIILAKTGDHRLVKATGNLKSALLQNLNRKKIFTDHICIKDGEVVYVDININVYINKNMKKFENEIKAKITERLEHYFDLNNWEFGRSLREKEVVKNLSSVKEVRQFDVGFTTNKSIEHDKVAENVVTARYNEIIRPDNININFTYEVGE